MAGVVLDGVSKIYPGDVTALRRLSLEVRDRELLVLVGPSGCGKSTTLRLIAGLEEATEGSIRIGERVVNRVRPKDRDVAMVFQNFAIFPHLNVYENMAFGLRLRCGASWLGRMFHRLVRPAKARRLVEQQREIGKRVEEAAGILGVAHLLGRMPRQLSGGERQRVALGRAMVRRPQVFLLDEPLSNLDAQLRVTMRHELKQLHQRLATTMIYVTHDQLEGLSLGERIVIMDRGVVQQVGSPRDVYRHPRNRFVAGFIGTPPMNFLPGRLEDASGGLHFRGMGVDLVLPASIAARLGRQPARGARHGAVLGVRPEDVQFAPVQDSGQASAGRVDLVEPLGDVSLVRVTLSVPRPEAAASGGDGAMLVGRVAGQVPWRVGDVVGWGMNADKVHLFDLETAENLIRDDR